MVKGIVNDLHQRYKAPTPVIWLAVGDFFLYVGSTMSAVLTVAEAGKWWVLASIVVTGIGKGVTNFAGKIEKQDQ